MNALANAGAEVAVTCRSLVIGHGRRRLLPAFDLAVARGEILLVLGRNGSGKTTFLKTLLGVQRPLSGSVEPGPGVSFAFVPQSSEIDRIVPVRARDLVMWGLVRERRGFRPWSTRAERTKVDAALAAVGAEDFATARFSELSGGQKQRVLFARLIASGADVVVLDEPTAAMDVEAEREAYQQVVQFARDENKAVIVVTHAIDIAARSADRVLFFDRRDGAALGLAVQGTAGEVFARPEVVRLFGEVHFG